MMPISIETSTFGVRVKCACMSVQLQGCMSFLTNCTVQIKITRSQQKIKHTSKSSVPRWHFLDRVTLVQATKLMSQAVIKTKRKKRGSHVLLLRSWKRPLTVKFCPFLSFLFLFLLRSPFSVF